MVVVMMGQVAEMIPGKQTPIFHSSNGRKVFCMLAAPICYQEVGHPGLKE